MFYNVVELSGGQQMITREDKAWENADVVLTLEDMNDDERKVIADLDENEQWDEQGSVTIDTADEGDLLHFAHLLDVNMADDWKEATRLAIEEGDIGYAEQLQEDEEGYEEMLRINNELKRRTRFVACFTQTEK